MKNSPNITDRIVSFFTYYTFGMIGIVWLVFCAIRRKNLSSFCKFHIYQSIFFSIIIYLISLMAEISLGFMMGMPFIGSYVKYFIIYIAQTPVYASLSLIHFIIFALTSYLAFFALFGKFTYFPFISDMVKSNLEIE